MRGRLRLIAALAAAALAWSPVMPAAGFRNIQPGQTVPATDLEGLDGAPVRVPSPGRITVMLVWRPGQSLSQDAIKDLAGLATRLGSGVDLVAVSGVAEAAEMRAVAAASRVRFAVDRDGRLAQALGLIVWPSTAVVGTDARLRYYLPSRTVAYPAIVEVHVRHARGELSDEELSRRLTALGQPAEAQAPQRADAQLQLGWGELEAGRPEEALRAFETALQQRPDWAAARVGRGVAHLRLGRTAEGIRLLEEAVTLNPEPVRAHWELAGAYEASGDLARALEHVRRAYQKLLQGRK